jgi:hypothetical protein
MPNETTPITTSTSLQSILTEYDSITARNQHMGALHPWLTARDEHSARVGTHVARLSVVEQDTDLRYAIGDLLHQLDHHAYPGSGPLHCSARQMAEMHRIISALLSLCPRLGDA